MNTEDNALTVGTADTTVATTPTTAAEVPAAADAEAAEPVDNPDPEGHGDVEEAQDSDEDAAPPEVQAQTLISRLKELVLKFEHTASDAYGDLVEHLYSAEAALKEHVGV